MDSRTQTQQPSRSPERQNAAEGYLQDPGLQLCRERLNETDRQLVALLEQRMRLSREIGLYKADHGLPVSDPAREEAILKRNASMLSDPAWSGALTAVYRTLFRESRRIQEEIAHV